MSRVSHLALIKYRERNGALLTTSGSLKLPLLSLLVLFQPWNTQTEIYPTRENNNSKENQSDGFTKKGKLNTRLSYSL